MLEIFKNVKYRTVCKVVIHDGYELVKTHEAMMTDYDWQMYKFKLDSKGIEYRYLNADCILIIDRKKKEKES